MKHNKLSRFAPFIRADFAYRIINGVPLETTVLIPRSILRSPRAGDKKYPVMVRWHGGGFVVGHRMYEPWFAQWLLDLALDREAIIVTPDYRLLPESDGSEILNDVAHFWGWLNNLPQYMEQSALPRPDINNILCCGESSGGFISVYCALHSDFMLSPPGRDANGRQEIEDRMEIRAVISISAPLDATAPEYKVPRPRIFMGRRPPPPKEALGRIRAYMKNIPRGSIRTGCEPTSDMWELLLCIAQQALLPRLFGKRSSEGKPVIEGLMDTLDKGGCNMAPVWIVHGTNDTMCPSICSSGFAARLRQTQPGVPVHLSLCPGEHLFDVNTGRDADWVRQGAHFLGEHWPCVKYDQGVPINRLQRIGDHGESVRMKTGLWDEEKTNEQAPVQGHVVA